MPSKIPPHQRTIVAYIPLLAHDRDGDRARFTAKLEAVRVRMEQKAGKRVSCGMALRMLVEGAWATPAFDGDGQVFIDISRSIPRHKPHAGEALDAQ